MIIKFKLGDYDEICDKYHDIFENEDTVEVNDTEGNLLIAGMRRIVIPELHASFREAEWYVINETEGSDEDECETQCSVVVQYAENETNPEKYVSFVSCDLTYLVSHLCRDQKHDYDTISQFDCYINTDEFVNGEEL